MTERITGEKTAREIKVEMGTEEKTGEGNT